MIDRTDEQCDKWYLDPPYHHPTRCEGKLQYREMAAYPKLSESEQRKLSPIPIFWVCAECKVVKWVMEND